MLISLDSAPRSLDCLYVRKGQTVNADESRDYDVIIVEQGATLTTASGIVRLRANRVWCRGTITGRVIDIYAHDIDVTGAAITATGGASNSTNTIRWLDSYAAAGAAITAQGATSVAQMTV